MKSKVDNVILDGTNRSLQRLFNVFNRQYWNGQIDPRVRVRFSKTNLRNLGEFHHICREKDDWEGAKILICKTLRHHGRIICIILLHEMLHAANPAAQHGPTFKKDRKRLMDGGVYDDLL